MVSIGLALASLLAPVSAAFDLVRQLWPLAVAIALIAVLVTRLQPGWIMTAAAGLAALAVILPGLPEIWRSLTAQRVTAGAPGAIEISVGTHNLWGRAVTPQAAVDILPERAPDLLALQEANGHAGAARDGLAEHYAHVARCRSVRLFSNLPMPDSGCIAHPPGIDFTGAIPCDWELPPAVWARLRLPDGSEFIAISAHLTWPMLSGAQDCQRRNLARAAAYLAPGPRDEARLIILGDMNAAAPSRALARMERDFRLERRTLALPTFPAEGRFQTMGWGTPPLPTMLIGIDHIFAGSHWQTVSVGRAPDTGSDHRPVIATLRLAPQP